jgi:CheY-like chemotaxis protein/anti-sigma regulatory factor (Ser/Thr protein kinase)
MARGTMRRSDITAQISEWFSSLFDFPITVGEGWESFEQSVANVKATYSFLLVILLVGVEILPHMHNSSMRFVYIAHWLVNLALFLPWWFCVAPAERSNSGLSWVLIYGAFVNMLILFGPSQIEADTVPMASRLITLYFIFGSFGVIGRGLVTLHLIMFVISVWVGIVVVPSAHSVAVASLKGVLLAAAMEYALTRLLKATIAVIVKQTAEKEQTKNNAGKLIILSQAHDLRHFVQAIACTWENLTTDEVGIPENARQIHITHASRAQFEACLGAIRISLDSYIFAGAGGSGPVGDETRRPIDIVSVAQQLVDILVQGSHFGNTHQVQAAVQSVGVIPRLLLMQNAIQQMISSALLNALKFTTKGQISVDIEYAIEAHILHVRVSDTGPGMTPHQINSLTDMFATSGHGSSYGFGGFIMKQACTLHGSKMTIESAKGKGTTVGFAISAKPAPATAAADEGKVIVAGGWGSRLRRQSKPPPASKACKSAGAPQEPKENVPRLLDDHYRKLKLLIVDDCVAIADVMVTLVRRKLGHLVCEAAAAYSGPQALDLLNAAATKTGCQGSYDVVLTDQQMPEMSGLELIKTCRERATEQPGAPNPKFFIFSADAYQGTRAAINAMGIRLLVKPVSIGEIGDVLETIITTCT